MTCLSGAQATKRQRFADNCVAPNLGMSSEIGARKAGQCSSARTASGMVNGRAKKLSGATQVRTIQESMYPRAAFYLESKGGDEARGAAGPFEVARDHSSLASIARLARVGRYQLRTRGWAIHRQPSRLHLPWNKGRARRAKFAPF